jgi:uncharacterized membrane protein HdeD (DUF308 family)
MLHLILPIITYAEESNFLDTPNGLFKSAGGTQTKNLLLALASVITFVGPVVILIGIVIFLLAKATDRLANQITGLVMCVIGIVIICAKPIVEAVTEATDLKDMTRIMLNQAISIATYIGALTIVVGITDIIMAVKEEDAGARVKGIMITITGFALLSTKAIAMLTGLKF